MEVFRHDAVPDGWPVQMTVSLDREQAKQIGDDAAYELANTLDLIAEDHDNPAALRWLAACCIQRALDLGPEEEAPDPSEPGAPGNDERRYDETPDSPLPDPPEELRDAWARFQTGGDVSEYELRKLDEWRAECAEAAGF